MPILKYMWLKVTYETYKRHDVKRNKTEENRFLISTLYTIFMRGIFLLLHVPGNVDDFY